MLIYIKTVLIDKIVITNYFFQFYSLIFPFAFNIFPNQNLIPSIFPEKSYFILYIPLNIDKCSEYSNDISTVQVQ